MEAARRCAASCRPASLVASVDSVPLTLRVFHVAAGGTSVPIHTVPCGGLVALLRKRSLLEDGLNAPTIAWPSSCEETATSRLLVAMLALGTIVVLPI